MKSRVIDEVQPEQFKPFKVEIEIESAHELRSLWHRINLSDAHLQLGCEGNRGYDHDFTKNTATGHLWEQLDEALKARGLKP